MKGLRLILVVVFALATACAKPPNTAALTAWRAKLLESGKDARNSDTWEENTPAGRLVVALETKHPREAPAILGEALASPNVPAEVKRQAWTALGRLGTRDALRVMADYEASRARLWSKPPPFRFGRVDGVVPHIGGSTISPDAECTDGDGVRWAVVVRGRFFEFGPWLTRAVGPDTWTDPIPLDIAVDPRAYWNIREAGGVKLEPGPQKGRLTLRIGEQTYDVDPAAAAQDSDKDGLTDIAELQLGTSPTAADTDLDGVRDGADGNPLTPKSDAKDEGAQMRQAIFFCLLGFSNARDAVVLTGTAPAADQEYHGYGGYVVRLPRTIEGELNIRAPSAGTGPDGNATGTIGDYEGGLAAGGYEAKLKKVRGRWVVTAFRMTMVS